MPGCIKHIVSVFEKMIFNLPASAPFSEKNKCCSVFLVIHDLTIKK